MDAFKLAEFTAPDFSGTPFNDAPEARLEPAPLDTVAPDYYHAMSIFPEYFHIGGRWILAEESRMDCVAVFEENRICVREFRHLRKGDLVIVGRTEKAEEGIFVHIRGFKQEDTQSADAFAFRQGRSRETAFSMDYDFLYKLLKHDRDNGHIVWVLGPACAFDSDARTAFSKLVQNGYVDALLAGNALAVHDLEGAYLQTALGQDIYTQKIMPNGHYNHLDTINRVRSYGSIPSFIKGEGLQGGIIVSCVEKNVPVVLVGSVRDDGPLPEVHANAYEGQDAMRIFTGQATTVICLATTLHTIAAGNMTPSYRVMPGNVIREVYFYTVDISEFAVNKLSDRGSLSAKGIVTNVQDFIVTLSKGLGL
ncbi:MAG: hypothetical protein WCG21_04615 [Eubacteriales bacterium]